MNESQPSPEKRSCIAHEPASGLPALILTPVKQSLQGYMCVGVIDSSGKAVRLSPETGGHSHELQAHSFPSSFQPRTTANMHHKEKVLLWLLKVPVFRVASGEWYHECYPGIVGSEEETSESLDAEDIQDVLDLQARRVTFFANKCYYMDTSEPTARPEIEYQSDADDEGEEAYVQNMDSMMDAMGRDFELYGGAIPGDRGEESSRFLTDLFPLGDMVV